MRRRTLKGAALWTAGSALALAAWGQDVSVRVELRASDPLRLVEYVYGPGAQERELGLEGVLEVTLKNAGTRPAAVRDLHVHGLLFVSATTGEKYLLIHPCDCAFVTGEAEPPPGQALKQAHRLAPGASERFTLEGFGCGGGMWEPPPPGEYLVVYRVLPADGGAPPAKVDGERRPPPVFLKQCRESLLSDAYWAGGFESEPLRIVLKKPARKAVSG